MMNRAPVRVGLWVLSLGLVASALVATPHAQGSASDAWRTFHGSWSAIGRRQTIPTDGGRTAAVIQLAGAVVLTDGGGASLAFQAEAIGFDDGGSLSAGRAVWTDARGHRVFSVLRGEPLETGRRIAGTITGGTGRYAGVTGDYSLTWQYIVSADDNVVQGRTSDLKGRLRVNEGPR